MHTGQRADRQCRAGLRECATAEEIRLLQQMTGEAAAEKKALAAEKKAAKAAAEAALLQSNATRASCPAGWFCLLGPPLKDGACGVGSNRAGGLGGFTDPSFHPVRCAVCRLVATTGRTRPQSTRPARLRGASLAHELGPPPVARCDVPA